MEEKVLKDETALEQVEGGQIFVVDDGCPNELQWMDSEICRSCKHCVYFGMDGKCSKGVSGTIIKENKVNLIG